MSTTRVKDRRGLRRHLEGWPGAVVALGIAGLGVLLGTPRPGGIDEVPLPVADERELERSAQRDRVLADALVLAPEADRSGPGFEVRYLGGLLRAAGEAEAAADGELLSAQRPELLQAAYTVLQGGAEPMLRLRAYQQRVFLRELSAWEATGVESPELRQVGGGIVRLIEGSGWRRDPHHFVAPAAARVALFKRRFGEVLGLQERPEFALTLDEGRALYAFLLAHPPRPSHDAVWAWRLRKVDELGRFDRDYPHRLARGIALVRLGQGVAAVGELKEHLGAHPDGPYALRARNALAAAVDLADRQGGAF